MLDFSTHQSDVIIFHHHTKQTNDVLVGERVRDAHLLQEVVRLFGVVVMDDDVTLVS